jgi:hypothetical protein
MNKTKIKKEPKELYSYFYEATEYLKRTNISYHNKGIINNDFNDLNLAPAISIDGQNALANFTKEFSKILHSSFEQVKEEIFKVDAVKRPRYVHEASQYLRDGFDLLMTVVQAKVSLPIKNEAPRYKDIDGSLQLTLQGRFYLDEVETLEKRVRLILDDKLKTLEFFLQEFCNLTGKIGSSEVEPTGSLKYLHPKLKRDGLTVLYELLLENKFLSKTGGLPNFRKAFKEDRTDFVQMRWLGTIEELRYLMVQLDVSEKESQVIELPKKGKWNTVSSLFCKPDGGHIPAKSLKGNVKPPKRSKDLDEIVKKVRTAINS